MQPDHAAKALNEYLDDLINDEPSVHADDLARASQLLLSANQMLVDESPLRELEEAPASSVLEPEDLIHSENAIEDKEFVTSVETVNIEGDLDLRPLQEKLPARFQALFFEVAGMTLAVPLVELGGIMELQELNKLPGKPSWSMGLMLKNQDKYHCVDTAKWVMPEKYSAAMAASLQYAYVVQLGKSPWALACEKLADTHQLSHDDIKWRSQDNKNPWLAGTIKQKMCALIDAARLISMLQAK